MSLVDDALNLGGTLSQSVDLRTGEIVSARVPPAQGTDGTQAQAGLSSCHNSPQVVLYSGASYFQVKKNAVQEGDADETEDDESPKAKRSRISEFSKKSRLRLMREMSKFRRDKMPVLVTLTYPAVYSDDPKVWKRHLDNFLKRLSRKFPAVSGVWKLEPQKRGAPHFHLLVWGAPYSGLFRCVPVMWYQVVKSGDDKHLRAGTRVEQVKSRHGVMFYASKYLGKEVTADWGCAGRFWGVFGRESLPYGDLVIVEVSAEKAQEFIRYMRRFAHLRSRAYKSLTITCNPDFWLGKLLSP